MRLERDATQSEPLDVSSDRSLRHREMVGELLEPDPFTIGGVETLDEQLLALHAPQRQVSVARGCGEPRSSIHKFTLKATQACRG